MTDHANNLVRAVGESHGREAVYIVLKELKRIFEGFVEEIDSLYVDDQENNYLSIGYIYAAHWCNSWSEELND